MINAIVSSAVFAALWISPAGLSSSDANVAVFRRQVVVRKPVARAEWRVTSLGCFEAKVNGATVSRFLDPGFTQPEKTRYEVAYDVTEHLRVGANELEATVAPTWWRCRMTRRAYPKIGAPNPTRSALRATLCLAYRDGTKEEVGTDASWLSAYTGPVTDAGVFEGERYDARKPVAGLEPSVPCDDFKGEVLPRRGPPVTRREDLLLKPKSAYVWKGVTGAKGTNEFGKVVVLRRYGPGEAMDVAPGETLVVDFGQNASAVPRFELEGAAGTVMTVKMSEMLNDSNGERARRCDGPAGSAMLANLRSATADIRYALREGRQSYMPRFTFFGYRYASIAAMGHVRLHAVESVPVSSVSKASESPCLVTGSEKVNRLVENVRWGFRSNYLEVPTDCPQRDERLGWTADTMAFVSAAAYSADVRDFLGKWLKDLRDSQGADGTFPTLAPLVWAFHGYGAVTGWSDAGVIVPHCLWKRYGDRGLLEEHWAAMTRYMDFIAAHHGPDKQDYGDWQAFEHSFVVPGGVNLSSSERYRECFRGFFFVWDAMAMKEMARDLGKTSEARRYEELEKLARRELAEKYLGSDGLMDPYFQGQTTDLFLLKLGLVDGAAKEKVKRHLVADIRAHGGCLQTGFLGTMILMETLSDAGLTHTAYDLLFQQKCPSWLFSVNNGATTIWERWDCYDPVKGFQDPGMNSFNHYSYGAVYAWMMSTVAGIRTDPASPGMRHFVLAPQPDERLGFVRAAYDAPCGRIESEWRCEGGKCVWRFLIPEGASATVRLPGLPDREYGAGEQQMEFAIPSLITHHSSLITDLDAARDALADEIAERVNGQTAFADDLRRRACAALADEKLVRTDTWTEVWPRSEGDVLKRRDAHLVTNVVTGEIWSDAIDACLSKHGAVRLPPRTRPYYIDRPIVLASGQAIVATGAEIRMRPGGGSCLLRNKTVVGMKDQLSLEIPDVPYDGGILVEGGVWRALKTAELALNGNGKAEGRGQRAEGSGQKGVHGVHGCFVFNHVSGLVVRNVDVGGCQTHALQLSDVHCFKVEDVALSAPTRDGVHMHGGCDWGWVSGVSGRTGDDFVAINAWDWAHTSPVVGPIHHLLVEKVEAGATGGTGDIRLLPGNRAIRGEGRGAREKIGVENRCRAELTSLEEGRGKIRSCEIHDVVLRDLRGVHSIKAYDQPNLEVGRDKDRSEPLGTLSRVFVANLDLPRPCRIEIDDHVAGLDIAHVVCGFDPTGGEKLVVVGPKSAKYKGTVEIFSPDEDIDVTDLTLRDVVAGPERKEANPRDCLRISTAGKGKVRWRGGEW